MTGQNEFKNLFINVPQKIRENLKKHFKEIILNYKENRWEPSELNGAKFSETVFRVLEWHTNSDNSYTPFGSRIHPFDVKLRQFENRSSFPNSIRFHIPKMLAVVYSLRNDRGVGHIGGDVNPNHMDSMAIVYMTKWIMAELIRIFHALPISEAQSIVEKIVEREIPIVWMISDKKRVLNPSLNAEEKTLVILHSEYPNGINEKNLFKWVEYSNPTTYKKILIKLHKEKFIEYDKKTSLITLSPRGIKFVEQKINLTLQDL